MTALQLTGVPAFLARYRGLRDRLPGDRAARDAAANSFRELGFPGRREEAWKYTNLRPLAEAAFHEPLSVVEDSSYLLAAPRIAGTRLVFLDGRFRSDLSDAAPAIFTAFADQPLFGALARPDRDPMAALNTMLAEDGARLTVPPETDAGTIHLAAISSGGTAVPTASHPRHIIHLGRGARLTLIETSAGEGLISTTPSLRSRSRKARNSSTSAWSRKTHLRSISRRSMRIPPKARSTTASRSRSVDAWCALIPHPHVRPRRRNPPFRRPAAARYAARRFHLRRAPCGAALCLPPDGQERACRALPGLLPGPYRGRAPGAETDGYQMSQALLLSPDAEIDTKPELEPSPTT